MGCLIGHKGIAVVFTDVFSLVIGLLLFRIPESFVNVRIAVLTADFTRDSGLVDLDIHTSTSLVLFYGSAG